MRWCNERMKKSLVDIYSQGSMHVSIAMPAMIEMRDDYESALLAHQAQAVKLAQRVNELEAAHDARGLGALALAESRGQVIATLIDERILLGRRIFELEQQLSAALATIERACGEEKPDGALYAEGCAP